MNNSIQIDYYSDVLCVWAYIGHARTCALQEKFSSQLNWSWHFIPVFGDVTNMFLSRWEDKGGAAGYAAHLKEVIMKYNHVTLNEACWSSVRPASSVPAHLWLAATRLAECAGELPANSEEKLVWAIRLAFFEQAKDIALQSNLVEVTESLGLDRTVMLKRINDGTAYAAMFQDIQMAHEANIDVSPTYVFNEDRQRLTGNVGYRIVEANIKELLQTPHKQYSWC